MVLIQFISFWLLRNASWQTLVIMAYCLGGVVNHSLTLAVHEIAHNLAFGHSRPMANRLFGFFANLPIGIPMSISFKKYHLEHHRYQVNFLYNILEETGPQFWLDFTLNLKGDDKLDTDIPTKLEAVLFCNTGTKILWVLLQPFFYSLRPFMVNPKPPSTLELINVAIQITFDALLWYFCGNFHFYFFR